MSYFNYTDRFLPNLNQSSIWLPDNHEEKNNKYEQLLKERLTKINDSSLSIINEYKINKIQSEKKKLVSLEPKITCMADQLSTDFYAHPLSYSNSVLTCMHNYEKSSEIRQINIKTKK